MVHFFDRYNQYSSVFGIIRHNKCTFTNFIPVLNEGAYNAYVQHDIVMNDCVFNVSPEKNYLFSASRLNGVAAARHELSEKCLPNILIKNLTVNMIDGADAFYLFLCRASGSNVSSVSYLSSIIIDGLIINSDDDKSVKSMALSNISITTKKPVKCKFSNVVVNQPRIVTKNEIGAVEMQLKTNMSVKDGKVEMRRTSGIRQ